MAFEELINVLKPGDVFRDWLMDVVGDKVHDEQCKVSVYRYSASHTVCWYEFMGEHYGVFAKFYAKPRGGNRRYDTGKAMDNEFKKLKRVEKLIDISKPLAKREIQLRPGDGRCAWQALIQIYPQRSGIVR